MNFLVCRGVMAYLVEQTAKRKRRNKGDFLAPFSTRIQLKKKRTIITTRFFLNAHIKTTKQHLHPIPFLATAILLNSFFGKLFQLKEKKGKNTAFMYCVCL